MFVSTKLIKVNFTRASGVFIVGCAGDLLGSSIKRKLGINEFSTVFGKHGGFLDRFDSTLLNLTYDSLFGITDEFAHLKDFLLLPNIITCFRVFLVLLYLRKRNKSLLFLSLSLDYVDVARKLCQTSQLGACLDISTDILTRLMLYQSRGWNASYFSLSVVEYLVAGVMLNSGKDWKTDIQWDKTSSYSKWIVKNRFHTPQGICAMNGVFVMPLFYHLSGRHNTLLLLFRCMALLAELNILYAAIKNRVEQRLFQTNAS